jgi:hypothetical protein
MKYVQHRRDQLERVRDLSFPLLPLHVSRVQRAGGDKSWTRSSWSLPYLADLVGVGGFISPSPITV